MKLLSPEQRQRFLRIAARRARRASGRKEARAKRLLQQREIREIQKRFAAAHSIDLSSQRGRYPILVPEELSLRTNYVETVECIAEIRDMVLTGHIPVALVFDKLRYLEPSATLLLTAEIFRARQLRPWRGGKIVSGNYPRRRDVFQQLREMGFFRLLQVDERESMPDDRLHPDRPFFVRFHTMSTVDPRMASVFCDAVAKDVFKMDALTQGRMVAALKEAMGNAHEHGYKFDGDYPVLPNRWWLAGHLDPKNREMMIMILDQGVGIPRTLTPTYFEMVKAAMQWSFTPTDGAMIAAATELHRTSTDQGGRGRGFADMKRVLDSCDDGELRVLSNRGSYTYMKGRPLIEDREQSICGTLVEWRVRHDAVLEADDA